MPNMLVKTFIATIGHISKIMQDFKYFDYEYTGKYALYQPVLGVFLLVLPATDHVMTQLMAVMSSRYLLQPICIGDAENFTPTLIDNSVCHNWSLTNKHDLNTRTFLTELRVVSAEKLVETTSSIDWDIDQEKRWIMMCHYWLKFVNFLFYKQTGYWIESIMNDVLDFSEFTDSKQQQFRKAVMKLLYLGKDLDQTDQAILELINNNQIIFLQWQRYTKQVDSPIWH